VLDVLDVPEGSRVADLGGGLGQTVSALGVRRPDLDLLLAELPGTAARARLRLGADSRVRVVAIDGDDPLDPAVDRVLIARVLVTLADEQATALLDRARRSLRPGGRVELVEPLDDGSAPAAFGDLLNLARSGGGVRTQAAWTALAAAAGLRVATRTLMAPPFVHLSLEPEVRS
jgi:SAM-dependent methyltransferase